MRIQRAAVLALFLLGAAGPGCSDDDDSDQPILVVQAASEQPGADELGVIVSIQSRGGKWLEIEVSGGLLGSGSHGTCLLAPTADSLRENVVNVLVIPTRVEAVVTVRLLPNGTRVREGVEGAGQAGMPLQIPDVGPCRLDVAPLKQVIRPVQRVAPLPAAAGNGGASGSSGKGAGGIAGGAATAGSSGTGGVSGDTGSGGTAGDTGGAAGTAGANESGGASGSAGAAGGGVSGMEGVP